MTALFSSPSVNVSVKDTTVSVVGDVDVTLAAELAASGVKWLQTTELTTVTFDFSAVDKASSVAISVLFEWLRICQQRAINVHAIRFSAPLQRLASLAELDDLIAHPAAMLAV
ncbi:MAG: anti-sigma-factor antagonist (STAS) domain-containing protein [Halomonas sp. 54_146]|nr:MULTISPECIES: STAS domain-containing protein [unclassified Halomonas]KUJ89497.1 MAG: anti-sigma-factor antagonist (STAS) domain-containing protein [Halomonas sp. 54_146]HAA46201.1 anti-anti-sigma factor [Halomonas sp.]